MHSLPLVSHPAAQSQVVDGQGLVLVAHEGKLAKVVEVRDGDALDEVDVIHPEARGATLVVNAESGAE